MKHLIHLVNTFEAKDLATMPALPLDELIDEKLKETLDSPKWTIEQMSQSTAVLGNQLVVTTTLVLDIMKPKQASGYTAARFV